MFIYNFSFCTFFGVNSAIKNIKDLNLLEYKFKNATKLFVLSYKRTEKKDTYSNLNKKDLENSKTIDKKNLLKNIKDKGTGGGFFDGEVIISKGVLAIDDGAKNMIVEREKSVFSIIDESIKSKPVKGYKELTNLTGQTFDRQKNFETAKVDITKEEKLLASHNKNIELENPERLKTDMNIKNVQILKGKRPESEIISTIARHKKGLEFLYIDEREKDQSLQGRVVVKIEISSNGIVSNAEVVDTDINDKEFIQKIIFLVKSIRFSDSEYGDTIVKIPLVFLPA